MVKNNQSFSIKLEADSIRRIEQIVDLVCDQLFINDTYYGSILTALTELFEIMLIRQKSETFKIEYNTDYQKLTFRIYPVDHKIASNFEDEFSIDMLLDEEPQTSIFLIKSLVDSLHVEDKEIIQLSFDISALHNKIYEQRATQLKDYFKVKEDSKVNENNDQL
ncbi:MAG: hypothetical protein DRI89_00620 [Bacteroidetes bacterium]|nr:MAG: hypothetical protein DRI89_00620 [Bacteroidota bacterium]